MNQQSNEHQSATAPNVGRIGVVMTTYNQPESLAKSLLSFSLQTDGDFDVLVADDGSDRRTAEVIERFSNSLMIRHVWHPDTGFAKCEILNKAIAVSDHDYLIFTDGDCIVARDFVAIHRRHARPGHFLSGTYNNLPASFGDIVSEHAITSGDAFELAWLRGRGLPKSRMDWRMHRSQILKRVLNATTTTRPNWNGCNVSGWRRDLIAANGFDERMGHGGLDRELGYRLNHAGIRGSHVRFLAICLHCDHQRGYADPETLENNRSILATTRRNRLTRTTHGLEEMLKRHHCQNFQSPRLRAAS